MTTELSSYAARGWQKRSGFKTKCPARKTICAGPDEAAGPIVRDTKGDPWPATRNGFRTRRCRNP